jgi:predicted outer membrane repeat protein
MRGQAANEGGAIRSLGSLYVTNVAFTSNNADAGGGAIYSYGVTEIHQSDFINNNRRQWRRHSQSRHSPAGR